MYYYNSITKKYHISMRKAEEAADSFSYNVKESRKYIDLIGFSELKDILNLKIFDKWVEVCSQNPDKIDGVYITFDEDLLNETKETLDKLVEFYIASYFKKDLSSFNIKLTKDYYEDGNENGKKLHHVNYFIHSLLSDLNVYLYLGVYPRYLKDFLDEDYNPIKL
jgi:hypothetical protein